jgi:hypothetical protein
MPPSRASAPGRLAALGSPWPKLFHIGTGRAHAGTRVLLLVQDLYIRAISAAAGELLRELVLNPDKRYQPTGKPSGWSKKTPRPLCGFAMSSMGVSYQLCK